MNAIFIHDLRVQTRIGIYEWEAALAQTIRLDVELGLPSDDVFRSGDFADALDYAAVVKRLQTSTGPTTLTLGAIADGAFSTCCIRVKLPFMS